MLVFTYLLLLIFMKKIPFLPHVCKAWTVDSTFSMYSCSIFRENNQTGGALMITEWERKKCPWWLGMKRGECLEEDKEIYLRHLKGECMSDSGSSGSVNEEEKKRIDEELQALKEKDLQEEIQASNKGGRPPNKSVIESPGNFTILM